MRAARLAALALALSLGGGVAWAQPAPPDPTRVAAAQHRFERGLELFDRNDFAMALTEFRGALELYSSPNTRLYMGLCLLRTGQLAEAHTELQRTFTEARDRALTDPNYVDARDISERELRALRPRLGRVVLSMPTRVEGAVVRAGSAEILPAMLGISLYFEPGDLTVTAAAPGHLAFRQSVRLVADNTTEVAIALERAPQAPGAPPPVVTSGTSPTATPMEEVPVTRTTVSVSTGGGVRTAGFVVAGFGLASVAAFAVLGSMASSTWDEVMRCPPLCANTRDDIDRGETLQLLANVSLGAGLALAVTGAIMIGVGGPRVVDERGDHRAVRVRPAFDVARGTMGVSGAF